MLFISSSWSQQGLSGLCKELLALKDEGLSELHHLLAAGRVDQGMLAGEEPV